MSWPLIAALYAAGFALLYFGANWLIRGAVGLAVRLGVSSFVIGLTIVGFGTSMPELVTSLIGGEVIAIGNVAGSNLFNVGIVLALAALMRPIACQASILRFELPLMVALGPVLMLFGYWGGVITRTEGALLLLGLAGFLVVAARRGRAPDNQLPLHATEDLVPPVAEPTTPPPAAASIGWTLLGLGGLILGGKWFVEAAVATAETLGVSQRVIALTIVAGGTSLPELATSVVAALKGEGDIALGNVVGSNIFNILGILGICALVGPLAIDPKTVAFDIPAMALIQLLCVPIIWSGLRVSRAEGVALLAFYGGYLALLLRA